MNEYYGNNDYRDYLMHYGVKGMKWGVHKKAKDYIVNRVEAYKQKKAREDLNKTRRQKMKTIEGWQKYSLTRDKDMQRARKIVDQNSGVKKYFDMDPGQTKKIQNAVDAYDTLKEWVHGYENASMTVDKDQKQGKKRTKQLKKVLKRR